MKVLIPTEEELTSIENGCSEWYSKRFEERKYYNICNYYRYCDNEFGSIPDYLLF